MLKQCLPIQARRMAFLWVTSFCTLLAPLVSTAAANEPIWPQWRGPQRDDISQETGLLSTWPEAGPRQVWLFKNCGLGYSGPAIVGNRLYILGARDDREQLLALDMATGEEVWSTEVGEVLQNDWGNGPRGTPTVDVGQQGKTTDATLDPLIYALGGQGNLVCVRASDGKLVWKQSLLELGGELPKWGYAESPLIYQNQIICTPGGEQGAIAALDKQTGKVIWQTTELTTTAHYASPILAQHQGRMQCIQLLQNQVTGLDAKTGQIRWKVDWPGRVAVIPTPIYSQDHVYVSSGYGVGGMLIRLGKDTGEETVVEEVKPDKVIKNHHGGVILLDGHLYGHSDKAGWICQNFLSGEVLWRERKALGKGAIAYADGRFYCLSEQDGDVVLIGASPVGWQEHGRFTLDPQTTQRSDRGKIWTHPVICNGKLLLRDQELLFCFDVKEE